MRTAGPFAAALLALLAAPAVARADVRVFSAPEDSDKQSTLQSLDLYGWIQPRFVMQQHDERPGVDYKPNPVFTVRRARFGAIGWLNSWVRAQFEMELAGDVSYAIDAFVDAHPIPEVGITVGQFRVPFSRQNLIPSKNLQFADNAYWLGATTSGGTTASAGKYIVDRDIGAMLSGDLLGNRLRYMFGVFNGNDPSRGATQNLDPYFLWAGRIEVTPFGAVPRYEGDHRPIAERDKPLAMLGVGFMKNRSDDKHFRRTYLGADLGGWWKGASLYAEFYARRDEPIADPTGATPPPTSICGANGVAWAFKNDDDPAGNPANQACVTAVGWNVQAGYFPPVGWLEEHLEAVARVERFDPYREVTNPGADSGARDLDQSNPQWGYMGYILGLNVFPKKTHDVKLQASYEIRNETKTCLQGQGGSSGKPCTGVIDNNLLLVQATGAF